ncbi:YlbG family protein [Furfurilactobacillus siliginis]|uniref:Uncharacterized protein n=1 Tax=Furfurilactobacillus siliginis TaxID=348151 RepID=A0A510VNU9_9LACO|nr:YlbG family protein [Furfurilactobacillus siliginis]GEK28436.1 hypothetical protein LSI01_07470 [Furfurilactobacillus siliginis]
MSDETTAKTTPTKQRPRRRRPQRKNNQPSENVQKPVAKVTQTTNDGNEKKATNQRHRRPRRRPKKTTTPEAQTTAKTPVAAKTAVQAASTKPKAVTSTVKKPAAPRTPVVKKDVTKAFVDHETLPLTVAPRRALHVYVRNLRQVRQLRRFGEVDYVSKKLHYVVIYMNEEDVATNRQALNKLPFVRRVVDSARPDVDPYVGHGVNANFVTHTQDDGAADAVSKSTVEDDD